MRTFYFSGNLKKKKYSNWVRIYVSCFTKVCNIQNTQYSKLFWFTIDSSVLLNGVQFFFHCICHFLFVLIVDCTKLYKKEYIKGSLNISVHLSMKLILVDPNLVRSFFGNILFLILIMVRTLENNYFLCALNKDIHGKSAIKCDGKFRVLKFSSATRQKKTAEYSAETFLY